MTVSKHIQILSECELMEQNVREIHCDMNSSETKGSRTFSIRSENTLG